MPARRSYCDYLPMTDEELRRVGPVEMNLLVARSIPAMAHLDIPRYQRMADEIAEGVKGRLPYVGCPTSGVGGSSRWREGRGKGQMNEPTPPWRLALRRGTPTGLAGLAICLIVALVVTVFVLLGRWRTHNDAYWNIRADLVRMASLRPSDVPPGQWEFAVGWTINLHGNCAGDFTKVSASDLRAFALELKRRLRGRVDLSTIDWIWDEYARITKAGQLYSEKYRPTGSPEMEEARPGCFGLNVK